jgi:hypothetical protein
VIADIPSDLLGDDRLMDMVHYVQAGGDDVDCVSERVAVLLRSDGLRREIGGNARRFVLEKMTWDRVAEGIEKACEPLLR